MKTKTSNKSNILLIAITLLLLFVAGFSAIGQTSSWITDKDEIGFVIQVEGINITVQQGERTIDNSTGFIYLGTDLIEANVKYLTNTLTTTTDPETGDPVETGTDNSVSITNNETGAGYYIRAQVIAVVNGVSYNINSCITTSDLTVSGAWMYSMDGNDRVAMEAGETLTIMQDIIFPQEFIDSVQGQFVKLHLFIEGSATNLFDDEVAQN